MTRARTERPNRIPVMFLSSAYVWTWVLWTIPLAVTRGWIVNPALSALVMPLVVAGAFGPSVVAFALSYREGSARALFNRALRWRIPPVPLLTALFLSPLLAAVAVWIRSEQHGAPFTVQVGIQDGALLLVLLFFVGGSVNEEFGWAYAIDRIQGRFGPGKGALLVGVGWACWHLPLFFMPTQSQSHMAFWSFLLTCCSFRYLFVWVYNRAQQSILATLLFHTSMNFSLNLFTLLDRSKPSGHQATWTYYVILAAASALGVAIAARIRRYTGNPAPAT